MIAMLSLCSSITVLYYLCLTKFLILFSCGTRTRSRVLRQGGSDLRGPRGSLPPFLRFLPRLRLRCRVRYLFALKCLGFGDCGEPYGEPIGKPPNARFSRDFRVPTERNTHERAERFENTSLQDVHTPTLTYSQKVDATPQRKTARLYGKIFPSLCGEGFVGRMKGLADGNTVRDARTERIL